VISKVRFLAHIIALKLYIFVFLILVFHQNLSPLTALIIADLVKNYFEY